MRSRGPTLWLGTDQTTTAVVYDAFVRTFLPKDLGLCRRTLPRVEPKSGVDGVVDRFLARCDGLDSARDLVLIVHDWEDDLEDAERFRAQVRTIRRMARRIVAKTGLADDLVKIWFAPPTTEGVYLLFADHGLGEVRSVLTTWVLQQRGEAKLGALDALVRKRGRYAEPPHLGREHAPLKGEVDHLLGVRHADPKRQLAEEVAEALRHDRRRLVDDPARPGPLLEPRAACLKGIARWVARSGRGS